MCSFCCGLLSVIEVLFHLLFSNICFYVTQALKLSDDLHLNEVDGVRLLVSANQEVDFSCSFIYIYYRRDPITPIVSLKDLLFILTIDFLLELFD